VADKLRDPHTSPKPPRTGPSPAWADAARAVLLSQGQTDFTTYDVWIVSVQPAHQARVTNRLRALLARARTASGHPGRLLIVPEGAHHPGNLVATLLTWQHACAQARDQGWDLSALWRRGGRVVLVHAAGQGRRAAPLVHAEDGDRGALLLPGRFGALPARVLEAVLVQVAPLAVSQPRATLDVIWASQIFLPTCAPERVPQPDHPLVKLVSRLGPDSSVSRADVGLFTVDGDRATGFVPQGASPPSAPTGPTAADLGSFRLRADLLDVLGRLYLHPLPRGPRDLDPHLTAPLLGHACEASVRAEAERVREACDTADVVGVCDLGTDLPWWRLRRPAELRQAALDVLPSGGHTGLRRLLGVTHPVSRSWLGDVWIEGPELGWDQVAEGVELGGVVLRDSVVQDSALWPWPDTGRAGVAHPRLERSVVLGSTGGLDLEDAVVVASGGPGWRGGGGLAWRVCGDPPPAAGPSPTAEGVCTVRRPRLLDGEATFHGFLHEDGKTHQDRPRAQGLTWSTLARLPAFSGPLLDARQAPPLDHAAPHVMLALPAPALALLRERLPPRSHLLSLLELAEDGRFVIALHRGSRPDLALDAPLVPGRAFRPTDKAYRLHADLETWCRLQWAPTRVAEAVLHALVLNFVPAGHHGRHALARQRVQAFRRGPIQADPALQRFLEARVLDADAGSVLDRLDAWSVLDDPDRVDQAALYDALDVLRPDPSGLRTAPHLRAWTRWRLERAHLAAGVLTDRLAHVSPSLLGRCGFTWSHPWVDHGHPFWLPSWPLRPARPADSHARSQDLAQQLCAELLAMRDGGRRPVLGICGPAAAGKSSLAVRVAERLDAAGLTVAVVAADEHLWQGDGFRYVQHAGFREVRLYGPGIADDLGLAWTLDQERARRDVVIVEGAYVGFDPIVRERLDRLVGVLLDDRARLEVKYGRDTLGGLREIDVVSDFADKIQHESRDGVAVALAHADRIWDRGTGEVWT